MPLRPASPISNTLRDGTRDDILEPMVDAVVKNNTTYDVKLTHAQMHCRPVDGRALCAFGQIGQ